MQIQVLIDPIANNRHRACGGPPFPFIAEEDTPHDTIQNLRQFIKDRLKAGAAVCRIDVPAHESPMVQWAGSLKPNDPLVKEWKKAVEEYRRQADEDASAL